MCVMNMFIDFGSHWQRQTTYKYISIIIIQTRSGVCMWLCVGFVCFVIRLEHAMLILTQQMRMKLRCTEYYEDDDESKHMRTTTWSLERPRNNTIIYYRGILWNVFIPHRILKTHIAHFLCVHNRGMCLLSLTCSLRGNNSHCWFERCHIASPHQQHVCSMHARSHNTHPQNSRTTSVRQSPFSHELQSRVPIMLDARCTTHHHTTPSQISNPPAVCSYTIYSAAAPFTQHRHGHERERAHFAVKRQAAVDEIFTRKSCAVRRC